MQGSNGEKVNVQLRIQQVKCSASEIENDSGENKAGDGQAGVSENGIMNNGTVEHLADPIAIVTITANDGTHVHTHSHLHNQCHLVAVTLQNV